MNRKQESKFSMELGLRDFLNQNAEITSSLPGFGIFFNAFSENMNQILLINERQVTDQSGIARYKRQLKNDLFEKTLDISRKTAGYAKVSNNAVLDGEVSFSESELKTATAQVLKDRALLIHSKAKAHLTALVPYGVTEEYLTELKTTIDQFIAAIPMPRLSIAERRQATMRMAALFRENDLLLEKIDALVEVVRLSHPEFYATYRNNRRVIEPGKGTLSLMASITDAVTHFGIKGVRVSFTSMDGMQEPRNAGNGKPLVKSTAKKGMFYVKSMSPGTWTAIIKKPGYKERVVNLIVVENERTKLTVELERA